MFGPKTEGRWDSASSLNLKDVSGLLGKAGSTYLIDTIVITNEKIELNRGSHNDYTSYTFVRERRGEHVRLEMSQQMVHEMSPGDRRLLLQSDIQKILNIFFAFYREGNDVQKEIYAVLWYSGWLNYLMYLANNVEPKTEYGAFTI